MLQVRCPKCNRLLYIVDGESGIILIEIKCPKCKNMNKNTH